MRVYFEKPRTTVGWKGLINDPDLDGSGQVNDRPAASARELLLEVLSVGLPVACEFLDPITPQYISDLVSWGAIGARTTESQIHRQLASGLSMPIGFKNGTSGDVRDRGRRRSRGGGRRTRSPASTTTARPATMHTIGNEDCHVILRGGRGAPNYDADSVGAVLATLHAAGLPQRVIIDASHDNSDKDHTRQPLVVADIAGQLAAGNAAIVGVMLESFIVGGRQEFVPGRPLVYGQSITDACMDWDTSVDVLDRLATARYRLAEDARRCTSLPKPCCRRSCPHSPFPTFAARSGSRCSSWPCTGSARTSRSPEINPQAVKDISNNFSAGTASCRC